MEKKYNKHIVQIDKISNQGSYQQVLHLYYKGGEETIKISEMDDDEEIIITGKQLKELQKHWRKRTSKSL